MAPKRNRSDTEKEILIEYNRAKFDSVVAKLRLEKAMKLTKKL